MRTTSKELGKLFIIEVSFHYKNSLSIVRVISLYSLITVIIAFIMTLVLKKINISTLLIVIMLVILISSGFSENIGSDHLIQKANQLK